MAIQRPGETPNTTLGNAFATAQAQSTPAPAPRERKGRSFLNSLSSLRAPLSRNQTGAVVQGFVEAIEAAKKAGTAPGVTSDLQIFTLDNAANMLRFSVILVTLSESYAGEDHLAVFQLIVEGSAAKLTNKFTNINGQQVEVEAVAGDVVDRQLWDKISVYLQETYGKKLTLHNAGSMVLPTEMSHEDKDHVHRVLFMASQALFQVLDNDVTGAQDPVAISAIDSGTTLTATLDYAPIGVETATGLPVRSDVAIILRGSMQGNAAMSQEQVLDITRVDGFVDLVFSQPQPTQYPAPPMTQHYYPRYVITRMDAGVECITPELQLLALDTATLLTRQMGWGGVFKPRYGVTHDLRDIGAVGFEVNFSNDPNVQPGKIDTKSASFDNAALFQLLQASIHDNLLISMDIEESGELSWLHQNFLAAANNNQQAYLSIVEAANRLTDNHFSRFWQNGPIAVDDFNRIHLGYYRDHNGDRRDLRDLDYLALLNIAGGKDMSTVIAWSQTFDDVNVPLEIRLERRAKMYRASPWGAEIVFKGFARRLTFTPDFITALAAATAAAGAVIRPQNLLADFSGQGQRGTYNAQAFAVGASAAGGLFNYAQPFNQGQRGVAAPYLNRFQR